MIDEQMPVDPAVYERELPLIPYIESLRFVTSQIVENAPRNGSVLDLMTGTGFLPNRIREVRPDLTFLGVDIDSRYVAYGSGKYPEIRFEQGDVLTWQPQERFDVVMCTGAIHHLRYEKQEDFIARIPGMVRSDGLVVLSDCHINDYSTERERRLGAAILGYEYLVEAIRNGADDDVVRATVDIMKNDILMKEFKTSIEKRRAVIEKYFSVQEVRKTWPDDGKSTTGHGDFVFICREPR